MVDKAVFYFSASGVTAHIGEALAMLLGADVFQIVPKEKYTSRDLDWHDPNSRSSLEMKDPACRPEFVCRVESMDKYKTVLVGFPIWWYEAPRIIQSFLEHYDFEGKTIIPFATSGGSGMGNTDAIIQKSAPDADWRLGTRHKASVSVADLSKWIESYGI